MAKNEKTDEEKRANERRREAAARIIADNHKRTKLQQSNKLLLDQDALRKATSRADPEERKKN